MSTLEIVLTRMMHEALFADAVFADAESALAEYNLPQIETSRLKTITRARLTEMTVEERRAFARTPSMQISGTRPTAADETIFLIQGQMITALPGAANRNPAFGIGIHFAWARTWPAWRGAWALDACSNACPTFNPAAPPRNGLPTRACAGWPACR